MALWVTVAVLASGALALLFPRRALAWSSGAPLFAGLEIRFIGAHQRIDRAAHRILEEFRGGAGLGPFPGFKSIFGHTGDGGPDGEWIRGNDADSSHYYNPVTGDGDSIKRVGEHYQALVRALVEDPGGPDAARHAAFMAHYAADSLSPAHLHPDACYEPDKPLADNWYDPTWDGPWSMISLRNRHFYFEFHSTTCFFTRRFPATGRIDAGFLESSARHGTDAVERYLVAAVERLDPFPIFQRFLDQGWKSCRDEVYQRILPECNSMVATLWAGALLDAERLGADRPPGSG